MTEKEKKNKETNEWMKKKRKSRYWKWEYILDDDEFMDINIGSLFSTLID